MGACPVVIQVNQAYNEFVKPMKGSHNPPLAYIGLITCCFSSSKLKKHLLGNHSETITLKLVNSPGS